MAKQALRTALALLALSAGLARAWEDTTPAYRPSLPNGALVLDGSYVMNVGRLHVNITNFGLIGSRYSIISSYSDAASAQWPGGSQQEYLFAAGPWLAGIKRGEMLVSTGQYERELRPRDDPLATIYEAKYGVLVRPEARLDRQGARVFEPTGDDDGDGRLNEEILNGRDDDHDGRIDEDFEMIGDQMMVCTMVDNTPISEEEYPDHIPLGLEIIQTAYAWETDDIDDFIVFSYDIENIGADIIDDFRFGLFVDSDIGPRDTPDVAFDDAAGRYTGMVQSQGRFYEKVDVAYMYDGAAENPLPGYFGVMFLGGESIGTFQRYSGTRPYELGGEPTNDGERFHEMNKVRSDPDVPPGREADYRFLAAAASKRTLAPGQRMHVELALVCGDGLHGLLVNCARAVQLRKGTWYDLDGDPWTGRFGKETEMCVDDWQEFIESNMGRMTAAYSDFSCLPEWAEHPIKWGDLQQRPDGKYCIWVNTDNCDECRNILGRPCNEYTFFNYWNCGSWSVPEGNKPGCTGVEGRESVVLWTTRGAPPAPNFRTVPGDNSVHLYWNDISEHTPDFATANLDFESYRIYRADGWTRPPGSSVNSGPPLDLWHLVVEFDLSNVFIDAWLQHNDAAIDTLPLGRNTGLEGVAYRPRVLDNNRFAGLEEAMGQVFAAGVHAAGNRRPALRDQLGDVVPGMEPLLPWEAYPAVLDTFFWATPWPGGPGDVPAKRGVGFYEFVDPNVQNGLLYFYSITATDHDMYMGFDGPVILGPGMEGSPSARFVAVRPGTPARTYEDIDQSGQRIFVYPNPATIEALANFQQMSPNGDDPTGVRIMFANLPASRGVVKIFTLNGDLVQTVPFDGSGGDGETSWNLVSRNGQQIVSGIYLYVVQAERREYRDFIGKFVVIR